MKQREIARLLLPALGLMGITSLAHAQADLYTINGNAAEDLAGTSVGGAGLFSADGNRDIVVGSPQNFLVFGASPGRASVHNGLTGSSLITFFGDDNFDGFGCAVAGGFDLNNDGRDDVIIGAPNDGNLVGGGGMARVFSGATNGLLLQIDGTNVVENLGTAVSGCGDVNNDGFDDVIVGSPGDDTNGTGAGKALVVSGDTGIVLWTILGANSGDALGISVTGMGDLTGDNMDEFAVGSALAGARIYNGATGLPLHTFPSTGSDDFYGISVGNAGDVNGDMVNDLIIGATQDDILSPGAGFAEVRSGVNGLLLDTIPGDAVEDRFGISVDGAGDQNGDGRAEVIIGADQFGAGGNGYARVIDGMTGGSLYSVTSADPTNNQLLGTSVAGLGDVNGDGSLEVAVGAPFAGGVGATIARGETRVVSGPGLSGCQAPTTFCTAGTNSTGGQALISATGSASISAQDLVLRVDGAIPNQLGIFFYGNTALNAIPIMGTDGFRCVGSGGISTYRLGPNISNGSGTTIALLDYNSGPPSGATHGGTGAITAGSTWYFQYFYRDPAGTGGRNYTNGLQATFCP